MPDLTAHDGSAERSFVLRAYFQPIDHQDGPVGDPVLISPRLRAYGFDPRLNELDATGFAGLIPGISAETVELTLAGHIRASHLFTDEFDWKTRGTITIERRGIDRPGTDPADWTVMALFTGYNLDWTGDRFEGDEKVTVFAFKVCPAVTDA